MNRYTISIISVLGSSRRERFDSVDIPFSFFDAKCDNASKLFNESIAKNIYEREIRQPEIGCTLSHVQVITDFINGPTTTEWKVVLEDDASFESGFFDFINELNNYHNDKPSILILGHSKTIKKFSWVQKLKQPMTNTFFVGCYKFGEKHVNYVGTVAYAINRAAAKLISAKDIFWLADDWKIINTFGINVFHIESNLVYECYDGVSSTGNKIHIRHDIVTHPGRNMASIFLNQLKALLLRVFK